ncbi:MAG: GTP-binding protein, partial [Spirochaetaceae bacterium]
MKVLRVVTAGSVDDGKSTLIGRLLYDARYLHQDQVEDLTRPTGEPGAEHLDLALVTDGLKAEAEKRITIDVAYRYLTGPEGARIIIADTPGHELLTRNMVTGASTADLALLLIDASRGLLTQTRRHALLALLLGVPHILLCVNKMDLVDYSRSRFEEL